MSDPVALEVKSIFGAETRRGLVELTIGEQVMAMTPFEARKIAMFLLDGAASAEADEALMAVLGEVGMPDTSAATMLQAIREHKNRISERED